MKPAHPLAKDRRPVKVTRLELRCGFVRAIVKDNWWPDSITAVAVDGREVGPGDSVVLKPLVKRADPHGLDPRGDQRDKVERSLLLRNPEPICIRVIHLYC